VTATAGPARTSLSSSLYTTSDSDLDAWISNAQAKSTPAAQVRSVTPMSCSRCTSLMSMTMNIDSQEYAQHSHAEVAKMAASIIVQKNVAAAHKGAGIVAPTSPSAPLSSSTESPSSPTPSVSGAGTAVSAGTTVESKSGTSGSVVPVPTVAGSSLRETAEKLIHGADALLPLR
jgi:hypothetical protein